MSNMKLPQKSFRDFSFLSALLGAHYNGLLALSITFDSNSVLSNEEHQEICKQNHSC